MHSQITIKKEKSEELDMWGFKDIIFGEVQKMLLQMDSKEDSGLFLTFLQVRSKREDLDEMKQEDIDCKQESPYMVQLCNIISIIQRWFEMVQLCNIATL